MNYSKILVSAFFALAISACGSDSDSDDVSDAELQEFAEKYLGVWVGPCEVESTTSVRTTFEITDEPGELMDSGVDYLEETNCLGEGVSTWGPTLSTYELKGEIDDGTTGGFKVILTLPEDADDEGDGIYHVLISKIYDDGEGDYFWLVMSETDEFPADFEDGEVLQFFKEVELEVIAE